MPDPPLVQVGRKRREEADSTGARRLRRLELAEGDRPFYEDRPLAYVAPRQRERLARSKPGVGEDAHEHRVAWAAAVDEMCSDPLDDERRERLDSPFAALRRLTDSPRRVRRYPLPLDRTLEDALQDHEHAAHGRGSDSGGGELSAERSQAEGIELPKGRCAEARKHVRVPERRVRRKRRMGEVWDRVESPLLLGELLQRLAASLERS